MIEIRFKRDEVRLGEDVAGTVTWIPEKDKPPKEIKAVLRWRTEGRGDTDIEEAATAIFHVATPMVGKPETMNFNLRLPELGPVTYDGDLLRLIWEVHVRVDLPWAIDEKYAAPIRVLKSPAAQSF